MSSGASLSYVVPTCFNNKVQHTNNKNQPILRNSFMAKHHNSVGMVKGWRGRDGNTNMVKRVGVVKCRGLGDFIGGDLVKFDLGEWLSDVEEHKALAIYTPHEGGYEGRYLSRLQRQGYYFLDLSARGLGDPETTLTKIHPVCPVKFLCFKDFYSCLTFEQNLNVVMWMLLALFFDQNWCFSSLLC